MTEKTTTMKVYKKDLNAFLNRYGSPQHEAFRKAIQSLCNHPEDMRQYVMAELPLPGQEALTSESKRINLGGFYCKACRQYVFRGLPEIAKPV